MSQKKQKKSNASQITRQDPASAHPHSPPVIPGIIRKTIYPSLFLPFFFLFFFWPWFLLTYTHKRVFLFVYKLHTYLYIAVPESQAFIGGGGEGAEANMAKRVWWTVQKIYLSVIKIMNQTWENVSQKKVTAFWVPALFVTFFLQAPAPSPVLVPTSLLAPKLQLRKTQPSHSPLTPVLGTHYIGLFVLCFTAQNSPYFNPFFGLFLFQSSSPKEVHK